MPLEDPCQQSNRPPPPPHFVLLPPCRYNGYGTLEDSKQNCVALVPKPPKKVGAALLAAPALMSWPVQAAERVLHTAHSVRPARSSLIPHSLHKHTPNPLLVHLQDMHKLMNKDKIILRFSARMQPTERAPVSLADAGASLRRQRGCWGQAVEAADSCTLQAGACLGLRSTVPGGLALVHARMLFSLTSVPCSARSGV